MATNKKKKTKSPGKRKFNFSFKGTQGWIVALLFVSGWMFFLGILVGRGTVPFMFKSDNLQQELVELKDADTRALLNRVEINTDTQKTKKDLDFYEKLKQSNQRPAIRKKSPPQTPAKIRKPKDQTPAAQPSRKTAAKKTPPAKVEPSASGDGSKLAIQVGSFREAAEADRLIKALKDKGYPAFKETGIVEGKGVWYRVRVGYYNDRGTVDRMLIKLKRDGYNGYAIKK